MSSLDEKLTAATKELLDRLEATLVPGTGAMVWLYNREGRDLDVVSFATHESPEETVRLVRTVVTRFISKHSGKERWFESPLSGPPDEQLVSAAAVTRMGAHDRVRIWTRGGLAGELVVSAGDGDALATTMLMLEERTC